MKYGFPIFGVTILFAVGTGIAHGAWKIGPSIHGLVGLAVSVAIYISAISLGKLIDERDTK